MRTARWLVLGAGVMVAMIASGAALGVGPWPGLAPTVAASSGNVRYTAVRAHGSTTVKAISGKSVIASATFEGAYGIPAVTSAGRAGGLSPDGRLLVLVEPPSYNGLRSESRFSSSRRAGCRWPTRSSSAASSGSMPCLPTGARSI